MKGGGVFNIVTVIIIELFYLLGRTCFRDIIYIIYFGYI